MDLMFSVKELCRDMSSPSTYSWKKLMKVGKYVKSNPRVVMRFAYQDPTDIIEAYSDANWAGCKETRKSTSGGVLMLGGHVIKFWSKTQSLIALSSAESEFYATVKTATESMGIIAMMGDFRKNATVRMHVDASAALGVIQRQGIGKIRHLATSALWIQSQQLRRILKFHKILGTVNPADLFTKHVSRDLLIQHVNKMQAEFRSGRAQSTVQLHTIMRKVRQLKALIKNQKSAHQDGHLIPVVQSDGIDVDFPKLSLNWIAKMEMCYDTWRHKQCSEAGVLRRKLGIGKSLQSCMERVRIAI